MRLLRRVFRMLFAAAIAAQLAAPVLAANAKALDLFCPAHVAVHKAGDAHTGHVSNGHASAHDHSPLTPDETQPERNPFDLSCCSVHLTGVMPALSAPFEVMRVRPHGIPANDPATASPGMADPPPRIAV